MRCTYDGVDLVKLAFKLKKALDCLERSDGYSGQIYRSQSDRYKRRPLSTVFYTGTARLHKNYTKSELSLSNSVTERSASRPCTFQALWFATPPHISRANECISV